MRPLLALVHGIRITDSEDALFDIWRRHLTRGLPDLFDRSDVDLLYWVGAAATSPDHPLVNLIRALADDLVDFITVLKSADDAPAQLAESALPDAAPATEAERRYLKAMTIEFARRGRTAIREAIDDGLIPISGLPQPRGLGALATRSLRRLSRLLLNEIHAYLFSDDQRLAIREAVWAQLEPHLEPGRSIALVGHSLGALIVLDLLHSRAQAGQPLPIELVVTMGNPMAFPAILERLPPPVEIPPGIRRWVNISAMHDLVAVTPELAPRIAPCPATGIAVEDYTFENALGRWTWLESFHRAEGYLQSAPLAEALEKWLESGEKSATDPLAAA